MSEGYTGPQWQLYRFHDLFPYRYYRNLPAWLKDHICLCQHFKIGLGNEYPSCAKCGKFPVYLVLKCPSCEEVFLRCFRHPDYCASCHKCWDCTLIEGPCTIDFHQRKVPWDSKIKSPKYKAPRKFTAEELSDLDLDFKF